MNFKEILLAILVGITLVVIVIALSPYIFLHELMDEIIECLEGERK